ncbi:MAG: hypothetical protein WKF78_09935 [Candidatus Limnocylindrales bacterium]
MSFLALDGVQKRFPGGVLAVKDFSLAAERGEFVSFLGPIRLRQDDDPADDRRVRAADGGHDHDRRRRHDPDRHPTGATWAWSSSRTRCSRT